MLLIGACALPFGQEDLPGFQADEPSGGASAAIPAPPPEPVVSPQEMRSNKIAEFVVECSNRFTSRVQQSRTRYLAWVDPQSGPTGQEPHISWGLYSISEPRSCREATNALATREPSMPEFERAAEQLASAIERLYPLLQQANTYYERQGYRDDGAAQGRVLHPQLMAGFRAFQEANDAINPIVRRIEDEARATRLVALQSDPAMRTAFLVERTIDEARRLVNIATAMEVENQRLVTPDPDDFVAQVQTFQTHVDELQAHTPVPPDRAPQGDYGGFRGNANEMVRGALFVMRRVRDQTPFNDRELRALSRGVGPVPWGSPGRLVNKFNILINSYNTLRFPSH